MAGFWTIIKGILLTRGASMYYFNTSANLCVW